MEITLESVVIRNSVRQSRIRGLNFLIDPLFYLMLCVFVGEATLSSLGLFITYYSSAFYFLLFVSLFLIYARRQQYRLKPKISCVFVFYIYLILRNLTTNELKIEEWLLPNVFTLLLFIIIFWLDLSLKDMHRFIAYVYFFTLILMLLGAVKALLLRTGDRLAVFGGPNGFYKFAVLFESLSYSYFLITKKKRYILLACLGIALAFLTGSKGAFMELAIILPLEFIHYMYIKGKNIIKIIIVLAVSCLAMIFLLFILWKYLPEDTVVWDSIDRIFGIFGEDIFSLTSVSSRKEMIDLTIGFFKSSPVFGKGGMYLYLSTNNPDMPYAHNIFIEILGEQGLIGFILLIFVLLKMILCLKKETFKNPIAFALLLGFLVYFIGAQFSGGILDSKVVFFFVLLLVKYLSAFRKETMNAKRA